MCRRSAITIISVLSLALCACHPAPATTPELHALIARDTPPDKSISRDVWVDAQKFYASRQEAFAWVSSDGPTDTTPLALAAVDSAEAHGLLPSDYGAPALRALHDRLSANERGADFAQQIAAFDVRLTAALLQLGRHVATGRLSPKVIDARWNTRRTPPDEVAALARAASEGVDTFLPAIQPRHPEYQALIDAMQSLREQSGEGWPTVPRASLKAGQWNSAAVVPLRARLATSGYLPAGSPLDSPQFDADVERGLKAFQEHHALAPTGGLDPATLEKLNVPIEARLRQVAINLERWRWLPDDLGARHFIVNIPYFHLIARESGKPVLDIRVVVGKRGNETPLFSDQMETVVFSPYWNVPDTIALQETVPAMVKDPSYLERNSMEIVDGRGRVVSPDSLPWGDEHALAAFRFRQRPGAANALGFVKFLFPNEHAVYFHDTPADALFKRLGRAFSHGCVRVEEPEALAQYVLRDRPEWTPDAIQSAMRAGEERHVKLTSAIPVHIVYLTAWVDENGGLHFQDDVYGYDRRQQ